MPDFHDIHDVLCRKKRTPKRTPNLQARTSDAFGRINDRRVVTDPQFPTFAFNSSNQFSTRINAVGCCSAAPALRSSTNPGRKAGDAEAAGVET